MQERNITITLDKAKEWYNGNSVTLREVALQAFSEDELRFNFRKIKSLEDACKVLGLTYSGVLFNVKNIAVVSKASAAMFKLSIVRKALNFEQELSFTKNPENSCIYYPFNPIISIDSIYFDSEIEANKINIVGKFKIKGKIYLILGNSAAGSSTCHSGLGVCNLKTGVSLAPTNTGILGCASKEIAEHFSRYFGTLITEVKFGDLEDFTIIQSF